MLIWILSLALAGEVVLDAKVPARLSIDGVVVAELFQAGLLRVPVEAGEHEVLITAEGRMSVLRATVREDAPLLLLAGRVGVSIGEVGAVEPTVAAVGPWSVRFRVTGRERLLVQVDGQRVVVSPGEGAVLTLTGGDHRLSIRSSDGTMVYARGLLQVKGGPEMAVQIGEGALPETSGAGVSFVADGS